MTLWQRKLSLSQRHDGYDILPELFVFLRWVYFSEKELFGEWNNTADRSAVAIINILQVFYKYFTT